MPRAFVQKQAFGSSKWVWFSGLASLGLLFVSFAGILRRQVTRPLSELRRATMAMSAGAADVPVPIPRADELGALAMEFREMVERVHARGGDLRELNADLEQRVLARTEELHLALAHEKELGEMKVTSSPSCPTSSARRLA
jgi:HAMP domain-containing protein